MSIKLYASLFFRLAEVLANRLSITATSHRDRDPGLCHGVCSLEKGCKKLCKSRCDWRYWLYQ